MKLVNGNETFIGRRVIAGNIKRELPVFIQYLRGSYRHITAISNEVALPDLNLIEAEFTRSARTKDWLPTHIKSIMAMELHGRGILMVVPSTTNNLDTDVVYVPTPDFIFPINIRDLQQAPMLGIRYNISETAFKKWGKQYGWDPKKVQSVLEAQATPERVNLNFEVFFVMFKDENEVVKQFWYVDKPSQVLAPPQPLFTGKMRAETHAAWVDASLAGPQPQLPGMPPPAPTWAPVPSDMYPIFPLFYDITENPVIVELKGRAHADMHDQEALTMGWTSFINAHVRASELYMAKDQSAVIENAETTQTNVIIKPGVVTKEKINFYTPPAPAATAIAALQALSTENAAQAGQTAFAVQNREDSRKTATELNAAQQATQQNQTVPLTMFSIGYAALLAFRWDVVVNNINVGFNTKFLAKAPDLRMRLSTVEIQPAGEVDFVARQEKLTKYTNYYQMYAQTPAGPYFLRKILELAFPDEFTQIEPLLQDNSMAIGQMLLAVLQNLPPAALAPLTPDMRGQIQQLIQTAQQVYGNSGGQPSSPAQPMASGPNNATQAPGTAQAGQGQSGPGHSDQ